LNKMAKILKKKFFEIDIPLTGDKFESYANSPEELKGRSIKIDLTRKLKGKSVDVVFSTALENGKLVAHPKKITLLPFFIRHMLHKGSSYVEDSFNAETKDAKVVIKPFLITRKKVSRAVRKTLRNSAKNWILDYLKEKTSFQVFDEILTGQLQKPLSQKLKKVYPLAICEIRVFEIKNSSSIGQIEIKTEEIKTPEAEIKTEEIKEEITIEPKEKSAKKTKKSKEE